MCGITAIFSSQKQSDESISALHKVLLHRGPDYQNFKHLDLGNHRHLYLLHNRLSIVDLTEAGHQPMYDEKTGIYLIFNGEIYNFREIRSTLKEEGFNFYSNTDSEVLLKAYIRWGKDVVQKLNGMFAFALWDSRSQKLLVVRDRFGEKPLFWARIKQDETLIFASEMKVILAYKGFEPEVSLRRIQAFVEQAKSLISDNATPFDNIYQVEPATALVVNQAGEIEKQWQYWTPQFYPEYKLKNENDLIIEFHHLLEQSVSHRAACDVQLGACLSGGLDSTSIVGFLHHQKPSNFHSTISVRFDDDPTISEGQYIDIAKTMFNHRHEMISPRIEDFMQEAGKIYWHHEIPLPSISMYLEWSVIKRAKELGNIVMLDGQGADELLGGYPYYFPLYQKEALLSGRLYSLARNTALFKKHLLSQAEKYTDFARRIHLNTVLSWRDMIVGSFKDVLRAAIHTRAPSKRDLDISPVFSPFKRQIMQGIRYTSLQEQLNSADRNGMAFGIETRFPFLDYDLVDFCLKIPAGMLIKNGYQKYILRQAGIGKIPSEITYRKDKLGYLPPQDRWMRGPPLAPWIKERITDTTLKKLSFYNRAILDHTDDINLVWRWASVNEWMHVYGIKL